jgi:hypothetical protein
MVLPRKGLDIAKVWSKDSGPMGSWSACKIRGQARDLLVVTLYLKDGEGMSPTNLARLGQFHGLIKSIRVPWIILGDFNMGPDTLDQGGFLDLLGGYVITADNGASTCTTGEGSLLDVAIARKDIASSVSLAQDLEAPMEPSCWSDCFHPGGGLEGHGLEVGPPQAPAQRQTFRTPQPSSVGFPASPT